MNSNAVNPNKALWEKGDFTQIAALMRQSGEAVVKSLGIAPPLQVLEPHQAGQHAVLEVVDGVRHVVGPVHDLRLEALAAVRRLAEYRGDDLLDGGVVDTQRALSDTLPD